jgi:NodT family efflux transporter outer membrane factor (OMF) lipoprotein
MAVVCQAKAVWTIVRFSRVLKKPLPTSPRPRIEVWDRLRPGSRKSCIAWIPIFAGMTKRVFVALFQHPVRRIGRLWPALVLALLTGCTMIGPDFLRPSTKLSSEWLEANDPRIETAPATYREWWKAFDDPVLEHLIQTAYQQNLSLRIAGVRVFEARAQLGIAVGEFFPQAQQASGLTNYNRFSETSPSTPQPGQDTGVGFSYMQAQLGLGSSWELDFWGKYRRAIESADANLLSSIAAYDNALVTLTGDVANTYVQIRTLEDRLRIARENVEIQKESLTIARARFQGGVASERDVQQAIAELKNTEATVFQLDTQLRQTKNALCTLLGLPPTGLDDVLSGVSGIPKAPLEVAVGIPADLLRRRPDIRSAEYQAMVLCAQIGVAKADLYPAFSLSGSFGFLASDLGQYQLGDLTSWKSRTGSIGPAFQWNVLNYGQLTNRVRVQDARFQEALVAYQNLVLQAQKEVENGLVSFLNTQEQVVSLTEAADAARLSLDLAVIQYTEGMTDFTTVLTAQQNLLRYQNSLADSQGAVPLSLIAIYRALGGGWEIREGHAFIPAETRETMEKRTNWGGLLTPEAVEPPAPEKQDLMLRTPDW